MKDWSKFNRMGHNKDFWALVTPTGHWIDSAISYENAMQLAAEFEQGQHGLTTAEALEFFAGKTLKRYRGVNVIHSTMLQHLYENTNFIVERR